MTRNLMAVLVVAGVGAFGQQYPPQTDPLSPDQNGEFDNGQYADDLGVYAPAPPPPPAYAYRRPPMPGPGYYWIDGYWHYRGGRYAWTGGYWMLPPYAGGYWVAPRYTGGRFFLGFWGGGGPNRGYVRYSQGYRPGFSGGGAYRGAAPYRGGGIRVESHRGNRGGGRR